MIPHHNISFPNSLPKPFQILTSCRPDYFNLRSMAGFGPAKAFNETTVIATTENQPYASIALRRATNNYLAQLDCIANPSVINYIRTLTPLLILVELDAIRPVQATSTFKKYFSFKIFYVFYNFVRHARGSCLGGYLANCDVNFLNRKLRIA